MLKHRYYKGLAMHARTQCGGVFTNRRMRPLVPYIPKPTTGTSACTDRVSDLCLDVVKSTATHNQLRANLTVVFIRPTA